MFLEKANVSHISPTFALENSTFSVAGQEKYTARTIL